MIRLLPLDELHDVLDDAEAFYNEHYSDLGPFNREHFHNTWYNLMQFGDGLVFIEYEGEVDRGTFGVIRGKNCYTGITEYTGMFIAVKPEHRGKNVILLLMNGVWELLTSLGEPFNIYLASRVPTLEAMWKRLSYEPDSHRYVRRYQP